MINVLDHGFVRLMSFTQPALHAQQPSWSGDLEIVRNARVSYDADWRTGEDAGKDEKLIDYMMRNHHTSPFEALVFTFEVKAPIFVMRQWHRHRTWSYNEVSARYSELPEEFYVPAVEQITTRMVFSSIRLFTEARGTILFATRSTSCARCSSFFANEKKTWPRVLCPSAM